MSGPERLFHLKTNFSCTCTSRNYLHERHMLHVTNKYLFEFFAPNNIQFPSYRMQKHNSLQRTQKKCMTISDIYCEKKTSCHQNSSGPTCEHVCRIQMSTNCTTVYHKARRRKELETGWKMLLIF